MVRIDSKDTHELGTEYGIAKNSEVILSDKFLTRANGVLKVTQTGESIIGISQSKMTAASNNETVKQEKALFIPIRDVDKFKILYSELIATFAGAFVASNVITLTVNGESVSTTFATDSNTTLTALATAIAAKTAYVASATANTTDKTITVVPAAGVTLQLGTPVVTGGASQTTAVVARRKPVKADVGQMFDLSNGLQEVLYSTKSASTGQVQLVQIHEDGITGIYHVVNL